MEDIASLLEGLPLPRTTTTSLSDNFDVLPEAKAELVTVMSSRRLTETYDQLLSAWNHMNQKYDQLLSDVKSLNIRLQGLEQNPNKSFETIEEHRSHFKHDDDRSQFGAENRSNNFKTATVLEDLGYSSGKLAAIKDEAAAQAGQSATAPICFLLEFYPRPGHAYSGRIHHTLNNQAASFKGLNLEQILPFIKKHLPQPAESAIADQPIVIEPPPKQIAEPAKQTASAIELQPKLAPEVECSFIKEIGLIQESQKTTRPPFLLQANKRFGLVLKLELPISQQDAIKSNYLLHYNVEIKARHRLNNNITYQLLQHGGMNSKFPTATRSFYLDALPAGNYMLEIRVMLPQKNISEQMHREIIVV
jgi:hypothetical protein